MIKGFNQLIVRDTNTHTVIHKKKGNNVKKNRKHKHKHIYVNIANKERKVCSHQYIVNLLYKQ